MKMDDAHLDQEHGLISKGLYCLVRDIVGPECIVTIRRQTWDLRGFFTSCNTSFPLIATPSGSMAEGFVFKTSDMDIMGIDRNVLVLTETSYYTSNVMSFPTVLLMDTNYTPPGFTLLRCLKYDFINRLLHNSLVHCGKNAYISSRIVRESRSSGNRTTIHGPCISGFIHGSEFDDAYTLKSPFWPKQAETFISKSLCNGWPSYDVLMNICRDGCLLVPISSKQQIQNEIIDLEWRISFSMAEKKLIYSMNHCQFLCYGLMKIFFHEVLKKIPETGDLLCSYFMKTAVFYEISECPYNWSLTNFIDKFCHVFRRIMRWVSIGYCPDFFIPQHNMFYGKIFGNKQRDLLLRLQELHEEGYLCLLHCTSLENPLSKVIAFPFVANFLPENEDYFPLTKIAIEKITSVISSVDAIYESNTSTLMREMYNVASLQPTSDEILSAIKLRMKCILQKIALVHVLPQSQSHSNQRLTSNRLQYTFNTISQSILRRTKTFKCFNKIHYAVLSYRNGNYRRTNQVTKEVKQTLQSQPYMYTWKLDGEIISGCRQNGISYDEIVQTFILDYYNYQMCIEELHMECQVRKQNVGNNLINIPPLVFTYFLLILSYARLHQTDDKFVTLCELHSLLHDENGNHTAHIHKAISWEILGICQQLCGDFLGAYHSYVNSLTDQYNDFNRATIFRITILIYVILNC